MSSLISPSPRADATVPVPGHATSMVDALRAEVARAGGLRLLVMAVLPTVIVSALGSVGVAIIARNSTDADGSPMEMTPEIALIGFALVGLILVLVNAAWSYLGELGHRVLLDVYRFVPRRTAALAAKCLWVAAISWVASSASVIAALLVYAPAHGGAHGREIASAVVTRPDLMLAVPTLSAVAAVAALSVAVLIRNTPLVLGGIVLWCAVVEGVIGFMPVLGPTIGRLVPIRNLFYAAGASDEALISTSQAVTAGYVVGLAAALFAAALLVERRRDLRH